MTIQDVVNYINTTYFIILSPNCTGVKLIFGEKVLDEKITISDANILAESTVYARCLASLFPQLVGSRIAGDTGAVVASAAGKGGKSRHPNKLKKRSKNTKRSKMLSK